MEENKVKPETPIVIFQNNLGKYEQTIADLLGTKYGISAKEFMVKVMNAIIKSPDLLKCTPQSLFGSVLYFAEVGLPFNTPEGFGYILPNQVNGTWEATPIIGYKGLIEIAYRNPKMKSMRIQAVYEKDEFDYEYGTNEYIKHKPTKEAQRGKLTCVYAIANIEGNTPLFVVVNKAELDEIQKLSKSADNKYYNSKADVFNIMQSKVAIKLLFKTLPKTDNDALIRVLEMDNKFDYSKTTKIRATENGYELFDEVPKNSALATVELEPIVIKESEALKEKQEQGANNQKK